MLGHFQSWFKVGKEYYQSRQKRKTWKHWATNKLCEWLENEGEIYSLLELLDKMKELAKPSTNVYATKNI